MVDAMTEKDEVPENSKKGTELEEGTPSPEDPLKDLRDIPFDELREKGWKPRIKEKPDGKRYITLQGRLLRTDGKKHTTDRGIGAYTPERWEYVSQFFSDRSEEQESSEGTDADIGTEESGVKEREIKLPDKGASMFRTVVRRHGAIPPSVTYGTDIVLYFETFQALGYSGTIDQWTQEIVRNYLAEHQCQMHLEMGRMEVETNE